MLESIFTIVLLVFVIATSSSFMRLRIEWFAAMVGINYKPSKSIGFIVSLAVFYVVYVLIFNR